MDFPSILTHKILYSKLNSNLSTSYMFLILEYTILEKDMQEKVFKIITKETKKRKLYFLYY